MVLLKTNNGNPLKSGLGICGAFEQIYMLKH